jgi:hypothetical protein
MGEVTHCVDDITTAVQLLVDGVSPTAPSG